MTRRIARGSWLYALGLILLFTLAAIATGTVIYSVELFIDQQDFLTAKSVSKIGTWLLTMGFMFLAAGLGMWAIQYAAFRESMARLGSFIDAMDYLHDGLVSLNRKGRVLNANPAARLLAPALENPGTRLQSAFPCLSDKDVSLLIDSSVPFEIEREIIGDEDFRSLRFRSQPTPDLPLILISDVTERKVLEAHQREAARLQLIGRIARGVADDFNRILGTISGQTGMLTRLAESREGAELAANEISRAIQTGANLTAHLIDLSKSGESDAGLEHDIDQHVRRAVELLRLALPVGWHVVEDIARIAAPPGLSGHQVEQMIVNLGLISCDDLRQTGTLKVSARPPCQEHLYDIEKRYAAAVLISATEDDEANLLDVPDVKADFRKTQEDAGAVLSVVRSAIEEAGGRLDCFRDENGLKLFRIAVPRGRPSAYKIQEQALPEKLRPRLAGRSLLLAMGAKRGDALEQQARKLEMRVARASDTVSLLASIESGAYDAVFLDCGLVEPEAPAFLRAITRLRPELRLFLIGRAAGRQSAEFPSNILVFPANATSKALFEAFAAAWQEPATTFKPSSQTQVVDQA